MKKILIAFNAMLVSIFMISCGNNNSKSHIQQNVNVNKWEQIGGISICEPDISIKDAFGKIGYVYAKQVGDQTHYKIKGIVDAPIYKNPNYGSSTRYGKYKYCFDYNGTTYHINF